MNRRRLTVFLPALLLGASLLLATRDASAQYYGYGYAPPPPPPTNPYFSFRHRVHGYVGGHLSGLVVAKQLSDYSDGYMGHGGGAGLHGGIRLGPFVALELNWGMTFHNETFHEPGWTVTYLDSLYLMSITADVKVFIPTRGPVEPFFQAGVGFAYLGPNYSSYYGGSGTVFASGPTFDAGGGVEVWLGPWFSLGGRLLYRGFYFGNPNVAGINKLSKNFVNGVGLDLFATFHF
ncbi:MAG: hypothetical protein IT371_02870 [Deltaproteobacteria bacterium]|nr:hypothetical protein [Deltaproteobacteria bacterium]